MANSCTHDNLRYPNPKPVYGDHCTQCGYTHLKEGPQMSEDEYEDLRGKAELLALILDEAEGVISSRKFQVEVERLFIVHGWDTSCLK